MRGEYVIIVVLLLLKLELPPHARRIRTAARGKSPQYGTTSACAENTALPEPAAGHPRNYLRMRGEYH